MIDRPLHVAGLFSGIGGIELGLEQAGHEVISLCDIWEPARAVLEHRFPGVEIAVDVRDAPGLGEADLLAAGFPCTDLSQVGRTRGIGGDESGLVTEVFRLLERTMPPYVLLENVPNMLYLRRGEGIRLVTGRLEALGYDWAWRVVDSRSFGVPQRRRRVFVLASRGVDAVDPAAVLFGDDLGEEVRPAYNANAFGFSWTEGNRGLGWAEDATPTLKGGSGARVPSPPAIWQPDGEYEVGVPSIGVLEELQGFARGWTLSAPLRDRWKLVGNAVTVPVARWIGDRLMRADRLPEGILTRPLGYSEPRPKAACRREGETRVARVSEWPVKTDYRHLTELLGDGDVEPLSRRATTGFRDRLRASRLSYRRDFMAALDRHALR